MRAAVAAGHPATVDAGIEILEDGGTAADAAVAACLSSCVAETVMTGLLGGGHAIYFEARARRARQLDCFVAVPGLGGTRDNAAIVELAVPFGEELVHYAVGISTCAVPGLPRGLGELWSAHGRLPWSRLCEPALRLARDGVEMPPAHASCLAMLAPVMTMDAGARIYSPGGTLLQPGELLQQPGLVPTLEALTTEGAASFYTGTIAEALLTLMEERGGVVSRDDLSAYSALWSAPLECGFASWRILTRRGITGVPDAFSRLGRALEPSDAARALLYVEALAKLPPDGPPHTTNLTAVDGDGNACVLTSSLGLGSGDFLPGFDLHLNSMLGEKELLVGATVVVGERMNSMMAPLLAFAPHDPEPVLAAGAAGGTRLRSALVQVVAGVLDEGLSPEDAVARPRLHPVAPLVHLEPGWSEDAREALVGRGWRVAQWPERHHYFGGVSVVARDGAAGDPRRSGAARTLE